MREPELWDVVVVGGGPAGAAAARASVLGGARTLILERDALPRAKICGEYLCPGAVEVIEELGLGVALDACRTTPLRGMRLHAPNGREVRTRFPDDNPGLSVRRAELDPLLVEASGARVRRGANVVGVAAGAAHTTLYLASGEELRAATVIGADGRNGVVARQCGLRVAARSRRATLHAYFRNVENSAGWGEMHMPGDGSYFGLNPGPDGSVNVTYVDDLVRFGATIAGSAESTLLEAIGRCDTLRERFAGAEMVGPVRVLAPLEVRSSAVRSGRVLLAGDAAGFLDPLTGEGMYGALVSGRLAGGAAACGGSALRGYVAAQRRAVRSKQPLNRSFQWMLRRPAVLDFLGDRLRRDSSLGDALICVIGNVARPRTLLHPRHLLALAGWSAA